MALTWRMEVIEYTGGDLSDGGTEVARHTGHLPTPAAGRSALDLAAQLAGIWPADSRATADADTWVVRVRALDGSLGTARGRRGATVQSIELVPAFTLAEQAAALDPIVALLARLRERISPDDLTVPAVSRLVPLLADLAVAVEQALLDTSHSRFSETARHAQYLQRLGEQLAAAAADVAAYR